ncbi:MAG: nucleoside recognition domain-containing protein [Salibacteraceae bacterium]
MAFAYIWAAFILVAVAMACWQLAVGGDHEVFGALVQSTFDMASTSVEIAIYLVGVIVLWQGIMAVGERGGAVGHLTRIVSPFFVKLFPDVPKNHPALGAILMNFSANMLGLDNAATPLGIKAMEELQEINKDKQTASNAMIMFIVLNTSGLTIVPVSVMALRAANGAANPSDVFMPILLTTYFATLAGLVAVAVKQRINLFQPVIVTTIGAFTAAIIALLIWFRSLPPDEVQSISSAMGNGIILLLISWFVGTALFKKVNVYEAFIEGAKSGFNTAVGIIPYLVAILVAIGMFRASGAMDVLLSSISSLLGLSPEVANALPTALMKPLSGSGARGMMVEAMVTHGADSFTGRLASVFQGSTETTFYTIAVYFGAVQIKRIRYTLWAGLFADLCGIVAAIIIASVFFG